MTLSTTKSSLEVLCKQIRFFESSVSRFVFSNLHQCRSPMEAADIKIADSNDVGLADDLHLHELPVHRQIAGIDGFDVSRWTYPSTLIGFSESPPLGVAIAAPAACLEFSDDPLHSRCTLVGRHVGQGAY